MRFNKNSNAFTLVEILVVVALIAILATITFVAINPSKNFADTRNATRSADVLQILNAVTQYTSEQGNSVADFGTITDCTTGVTIIGTTTSVTPGDYVDLGAVLVDEYIVGIPEDPTTGSGDGSNTGYTICSTAGGRVQIDAPGAENGKLVSVKR